MLSVFSFGQEDSSKVVTTSFNFGGYVKADYLFSQYNNGEVGSTSPLRDIHLPSQIPVGPKEENLDGDFHVKESRFNFEVITDKFGHPIHGFLELDFLLSGQGDEKVSNSYSPRIRHFYFDYEKMLFGQTWSNFMIVVVPEDLDFVAAAEGIVFIRQPQFRFKKGTFSFSLENPETTLNHDGGSATFITETGFVPDLTMKKQFNLKNGVWYLTGIGRQLHNKDSLGTSTNWGLGLSTGGKINVGAKGDDIRMVYTVGTGLGRYLGLGFVSSGVLTADRIERINNYNGYVAYNHYWSQVWCSSLNASGYYVENPNSGGGGLNKIAYSLSLNLKFKPAKELMLGAEYMRGYRELVDGTNGSFDRIQISAKYLFGYNNSEVYEK